MVWTVSAGASCRELTDAGGFLDISLDFLHLLRAGAVWLFLHRAKCANRRLVVVCVYRHERSFLAFAALAANIGLLTIVHKSFYYLGLTEELRNDLCLLLGCFIPAWLRGLRGSSDLRCAG